MQAKLMINLNQTPMHQTNIDEALQKRFPEGVALVVCQDQKGMVDVTPVGWFMLCNSEPKCWAVSLAQKHYSHKVITATGEFVLCLPSYSQKEDVLYCGGVSGWNEDKLKKCHFKMISAQKIKPPLLQDCIACFECKVIKKTKVPDHTIFIGEILAAHISEQKDKLYNLGERSFLKWEIK